MPRSENFTGFPLRTFFLNVDQVSSNTKENKRGRVGIWKETYGKLLS